MGTYRESSARNRRECIVLPSSCTFSPSDVNLSKQPFLDFVELFVTKNILLLIVRKRLIVSIAPAISLLPFL